MGLLAALAKGAGGEIGRQAWAGLRALVRHPFRGDQDTKDVPAVGSGEAELVELERTPSDPVRAKALSAVLAARAAADADFRAGLERWSEQVRLVRTGDGDVTNTISGGTFYAPAVQTRDVSGGISLAAPPPPGATPETPSSQG
ncbi:hypothetical protein [Streptomyces ehimensis]|uniref:Uncharacterized protein n=1 Tax=Streptomyces ehimensis TaxID=68195 RepID=A0ABV9BWF8_9ACTN